MKWHIFLIIVFVSFILNCNKDKNADLNSELRLIAWNSLSEQEKKSVTIDWKQAPVTESSFHQKIVFEVRFNTLDDALLGPITVYVDASSKVVLGQAARD